MVNRTRENNTGLFNALCSSSISEIHWKTTKWHLGYVKYLLYCTILCPWYENRVLRVEIQIIYWLQSLSEKVYISRTHTQTVFKQLSWFYFWKSFYMKILNWGANFSLQANMFANLIFTEVNKPFSNLVYIKLEMSTRKLNNSLSVL